MYTDVRKWSRVRKRVMQLGESKRRVARTEKISRQTLKKMLALEKPPGYGGRNLGPTVPAYRDSINKKRGFPACHSVIRDVIKEAGFRWRSARVVLTSNDPDYREKLERVQTILADLKENERFFSIDEYGPFAIKTKPGRVLAEPGFQPTVPQWQKSKGWLIATAALELSGNQVTHFYSKSKNTAEMIRMADVLIEKYKDTARLYLSWDAASWHMSKKLLAFVDDRSLL